MFGLPPSGSCLRPEKSEKGFQRSRKSSCADGQRGQNRVFNRRKYWFRKLFFKFSLFFHIKVRNFRKFRGMLYMYRVGSELCTSVPCSTTRYSGSRATGFSAESEAHHGMHFPGRIPAVRSSPSGSRCSCILPACSTTFRPCLRDNNEQRALQAVLYRFWRTGGDNSLPPPALFLHSC